MGELKLATTHEEAVNLANEINLTESALKQMKEKLKEYVKNNGAIDTGQEIWDFYESVSWEFDRNGLKEVARNMVIDGIDPWEQMTVSKKKLDNLGWDEKFLEKMGQKKITKRFASRKN
ncbi:MULTISPECIES: hypothetical protein [Oceanobacillus]|uniref:hypothetical protein n=1 Tax=Oceanobacillus TaxID=182709 RepID=UPI000595DA0D|nr:MULTISPECIES: hypothetical protein [Oceanobacillus]